MNTDKAKTDIEEPIDIEIIGWNIIATWSLDLQTEVCAICRNHIMDLCLECQEDFKAESCDISWGRCGHAFHKHCIQLWQKTKNVCPLDTKIWIEDKVTKQLITKNK